MSIETKHEGPHAGSPPYNKACPQCNLGGLGGPGSAPRNTKSKITSVLDGAISDIERVRDPKMWRRLNGELVWEGQTPDGNEIETESPLALLESALNALRGLQEPVPPPPDPQLLASLLCETAPREEGHSWMLTARPDGPCTAHRSQAARLTGRVVVLVGGEPVPPPGPPDELLVAARFALKECEEITSCYPNSGDFWGLADNAAQELRRALAGEPVSAFARAVTAPQAPVDVERLNRAMDVMMEQAKNLRDVLAGRVSAQEPHNG